MASLADEPWKVIHPCKACVSTAQPLCHWPCSCYPNHAMGQTNDWMEELYSRWAAAHGDATGPENLRRMLADWLTDIGMVQAGPQAALSLVNMVHQLRSGSYQAPNAGLHSPREK